MYVRRTAYLGVLALATIAAGVAAFDCRSATTCGECLSASVCAWCSQPLRRLNGTWLPRRCVRDVDYGPEELCFGVLSTATCLAGYRCGGNGRCVPAGPGEGDTLEHCRGTCNCSKTPRGCSTFRCAGGVDDYFVCRFDPESRYANRTLAECSASCGTGAATPVPNPRNCTPPCIVPCDIRDPHCCPQSTCSFDFVWNDYRCHPWGKYCDGAKRSRGNGAH